MITSVLIDSREPKEIQALKFDGLPVTVTYLDEGDLWVTTDANHILTIERKTPEDLLGSLKDDRLFTQAGALADKRIKDPVYWPYLVITGSISYDSKGKVITSRGLTGWNYDAVMGGLLTVQEMGVPVVYCSEGDYENCVIRLGNRKRDPETTIPPIRPPKLLGHGAAILMSLPGIGPEMLNRIWEETDGIVAMALWKLTDPNADTSVPKSTREKIRKALGLKKMQELGWAYANEGELFLKIDEQESGK